MGKIKKNENYENRLACKNKNIKCSLNNFHRVAQITAYSEMRAEA